MEAQSIIAMQELKHELLATVKLFYDERKMIAPEEFTHIQDMLDLMRSSTIQTRAKCRIENSNTTEFITRNKTHIDGWLKQTFSDSFDFHELAMATVFTAVFDHEDLNTAIPGDLHFAMQSEMGKKIAKIDSLVFICLISDAYTQYQRGEGELKTKVRYSNIIDRLLAKMPSHQRPRQEPRFCKGESRTQCDLCFHHGSDVHV